MPRPADRASPRGRVRPRRGRQQGKPDGAALVSKFTPLIEYYRHFPCQMKGPHMTSSDLSAWRKNERTRLLREREALAPEALAELRSRIDHHLARSLPDLVHGAVAF